MAAQDLEARIQALEDIEAIRNLKADYGALADDNYQADPIAEMFTEDATWEAVGSPIIEGREAIRDYFKSAGNAITFVVHYNTNSHIEVNGDTAWGRWLSLIPCTLADDGKAHWMAGIDNEEYVRVDGKWKFKSKSSKRVFRTPFDEGWAKKRFA